MNVLEWWIVAFGFGAMLQDLLRSRISNRYLITGWLAGATAAFLSPSPEGILRFMGGALLPIVLLFLLFRFRMIGAGDIKLLSALGGMVGIQASLWLLVSSFLIGGLLAVGILTVNRSWFRRFRFFYRYVQNYRTTGIRIPYRPEKHGGEHLHFAVPVFAALLLWKGGVF
ncbi:MAG: prepilin peptidase [Lachnospiraceae bacterium]|nr:prepilin peptidase [Lachnospiraceae bacterium]